MAKVSFLVLLCVFANGCARFHQPPLPRAASNDDDPSQVSEEKWMQDVQRADVIYLSLTTDEAADAAAANKIADAIRRRGESCAFGWTKIPPRHQALLDRWQDGEISNAALLEQLARPERNGVFRLVARTNVKEIALGSPSDLLAKLRDGAELSSEERAQLPNEFRPEPDGLEDFAEHVSETPRLRHFSIRNLYRAHLTAEEMIAENVVRFHQNHAETKLLVFLPNDALINAHEVAAFVAQKLKLHQLILDRSSPLREPRPELLALSRWRL